MHVARRRWARRVDAEGAVIVLMFGVGFVVDHFTGGPLAALWLQLLLPISQLTLVYGLSCDDKLSTVSRMMRTRLAAGLGAPSPSAAAQLANRLVRKTRISGT